MPGHGHARQHGLGARAWALQEVAQGGGVSNPSRSDAELFQSQLGTDATTGPRDGRDNRGVRRSRNQVDSEPRRRERSRGGPPPASHMWAGPGPSARSHVATERAKGSVSVPRRAELFRMVQLETPSVGFSRCLCERCVDVSFTALPIVKVRETANCEQDTLC